MCTRIFLLVSALALTACGGGGLRSAGGADPTTTSAAATTTVAASTDPTTLDPGTPTTVPEGAVTTDTTDPNGSGEYFISDELAAQMTVYTVEPGLCLKLTGSEATGIVPLKIGALELPIPQGPRLWTDAMAPPIPSELAPLDQFEYAKAHICSDPLLGNSWGWFMLHRAAIGGKTLLELNPWLSAFDFDVSLINDRAAEFIPLLDIPLAQQTQGQRQVATQKNAEWQVLAGKLVTLLDRYIQYGTQSYQSVDNLHLAGAGASAAQIPEVEVNPNQEALPALLLVLTDKGVCAPVSIIGINVGDMRPEEFTPPVCKSPPPATVPTTSPPTCHCGTTTTTSPPCECGTTTTTTIPTCASGKCDPGTTLPRSTDTTTTTTATTQPASAPTTVSAGAGATNTSVPPSTVAPPVTASPVSASPTTNVPPPADG